MTLKWKSKGGSTWIPVRKATTFSAQQPTHTWVRHGPWAINEANVAGEASCKDPVRQSHQPAAPLVGTVFVPMARPGVEREPAYQATGYPEDHGGSHPVIEQRGE